MNGFSDIWADLLPVTHYLELRTDNILRGAPLDISMPAFGWLLSLALAYGLYAAFALLSFIFVSKWVQETKGKQLEDMHA